MKVLVVAEHDNKSLKDVSFNIVTAAHDLSTQVDFWIAGSDCKGAAEAAAKLRGVAQVWCADAPSLKHQLVEEVAPLLAATVAREGYSHVLFASTTAGKNLLPRVAALLDVQPISDVIEVLSADTFKRPIYAGNSIATIKSADTQICLSVRGSCFDSATGEHEALARINAIDVTDPVSLSAFVSEELTVSERPDLPAAKVIFSGGRGLASSENFDMLYRLADLLGGAVGASRAAVDAGFASNDMQVGQTGKIVAPDLYVAVGISGAIQHLAGMKESKVIVAINKDEDAPIFQVADYGLVVDLFDALPELESLLN
jgi:electron transfer flavoprotein alpha subunit